jgi:hypothetical protein
LPCQGRIDLWDDLWLVPVPDREQPTTIVTHKLIQELAAFILDKKGRLLLSPCLLGDQEEKSAPWNLNHCIDHSLGHALQSSQVSPSFGGFADGIQHGTTPQDRRDKFACPPSGPPQGLGKLDQTVHLLF